MASSTSSCCGGSRSSFARQWYGHAAGILLLWSRFAAPGAVLAAWLEGSLRPLAAGPVAALLYPLGYMALRRAVRLPLRHLKAADTLLLAVAAAGGCAVAGPLGWLPALGLFAMAWYANWWHQGSPQVPGEGDLPEPPRFRPPVVGPITAGYRSYDRSHTGVDFGVPPGTPVLAPAVGRVTHAGPLGQWGYTVMLEHGEGWTTLYAHLEAPAVRRGAAVAPGDLVGWSGTSGISTGPHVHVELRYRGVPVDPAQLVAARAAPGPGLVRDYVER